MMSAIQVSTTKLKSRPLRRTAIVGIIAAVLVVSSLAWLAPRRLTPGQVVDQVGTYRFPAGDRALTVARDASGNIIVSIQRQNSWFQAVRDTRRKREFEFEGEREWFLAVDEFQRLWVFRGKWDPAWGQKRRMSSGGTVPKAPAVLMQGSCFLPAGLLVRGFTAVSETGHWTGVPQSFFDRIPDKNGPDWSMFPPIPATPPQFTKLQQARLREQLAR